MTGIDKVQQVNGSQIRQGLRQAEFKFYLEGNKEPWQGSEQGSIMTCTLQRCLCLPQGEWKAEPGNKQVVLCVKRAWPGQGMGHGEWRRGEGLRLRGR